MPNFEVKQVFIDKESGRQVSPGQSIELTEKERIKSLQDRGLIAEPIKQKQPETASVKAPEKAGGAGGSAQAKANNRTRK